MDNTSNVVERLRARDKEAFERARSWEEAARKGGVELDEMQSKALYYSLYGEAADTIDRLRALLKEVEPFINKVQLSPERIDKASRLKNAIADETAMIEAAEGGE